MQKKFFPSIFVSLVLLTIGCTKSLDVDAPGDFSALKAALKQSKESTIETVEQRCDKIGFTNSTAGEILTSVSSDGGFGPIAITSINPKFPGQPAALVFNSANPLDPLSFDMGTPNEVFGGPGVGAAGESGPFVNNVALGNVLVISNFAIPPREDDVDGTITFQFPSLVTATSITVIDVEIAESESASVELYDAPGGTLLKTIPLPSTGQNGVAVVSLQNTAGVGFMKVNMNGSQGIDNIAFCRDVPTGRCAATQGFWKNHGPNPNGNQSNEYPVTSLELGNVSYSDVQLESILREEVSGNGLISLAHQLIAAKLNIASGSDPSTIQTTINQADALIADLQVPPVGSGHLSPDAVSGLVDLLTQYNEGRLPGGPGHCD